MSEKKRRHPKKEKDGVAAVPFSQKKGLLEFGLTQRGREFSGRPLRGGGEFRQKWRGKKKFSRPFPHSSRSFLVWDWMSSSNDCDMTCFSILEMANPDFLLSGGGRQICFFFSSKLTFCNLNVSSFTKEADVRNILS